MDYQPGQQVLIIVKDPDKLAPHNLEPYQIETVHVNGTVIIEQPPIFLNALTFNGSDFITPIKGHPYLGCALGCRVGPARWLWFPLTTPSCLTTVIPTASPSPLFTPPSLYIFVRDSQSWIHHPCQVLKST